MKFARVYIMSFFVFMFSFGYAQEKNELKEINSQIWNNFTKAFETLNLTLFESLHSQEFIRINADNKNIRNKENYIDGYRKRWRNTDIDQTISFRFLERLSNDSISSERGIYNLTRSPNTDEKISYFGKFHVILKKENAVWKIVIDYDSSENNTIDINSYEAAFAIDDYAKF